MSHGSFSDDDHGDDNMLSEINMIPLIDVMLVLLIVFIITVPVMKHAVNIDLPRASNEKELVKPETVRLSVDADGAYYWNEQKLPDDNALVRGNKSILGGLNSFAHDLHAYFVTGARVNAGGEPGKVLPMKKGS